MGATPLKPSSLIDIEADGAMERYADGDDSAFRVLYEALGDRLHAFLLRMTKSPAVAEELVQDTFLRMHRARGTFRKGASVVAWSYAIARNVYIDQVRTLASKKERVALSDEEDPSVRAVAGP